MKNILKIFLIVYLFFVSINTNTFAVDLSQSAFTALNSIQTIEHNENTIYNEKSQFEKFIVPTSRTSESIIFSQKKNDSDSGFGGFKDLLIPEDSQFSLLLSYIYNKSCLDLDNNSINKKFLTEISPNAP